MTQSAFKTSTHHRDAILADADPMPPQDLVPYTRDIVVPLIEHLGGAMAHAGSSTVACTLVALASEVDKRLTQLENDIVTPA